MKPSIIRKLGKGAYGTVYLVDMAGKGTGVLKAVKVITSHLEDGVHSLIEVDIMSKLHHPYLIHADRIEVHVTKHVQLNLYMELALGDMCAHIKRMSIRRKLLSLHQISDAVKALHDNGYIHLDIKPSNILVYNDKIKLTDFGLSLYVGSETHKFFDSELVTSTHRPPEIFGGLRHYSKAVDIWSLGITFLNILLNSSLYDDYSDSTIRRTIETTLNKDKIDSTLSDLPKSCHRLIPLFKKMLDFNPDNRPSIDQVLSFLNVDTSIESKRIDVVRRPPKKVDEIYYYGFDFLVRLACKFSLSTEKFFLSADLYQRSLIYTSIVGNFKKDWPNILLLVNTCMYMAIKTIATPMSPHKFVEAAGNHFKLDDMIKMEAALISRLKGVIYPTNLYNSSHNIEDLCKAFDVVRNPYVPYDETKLHKGMMKYSANSKYFPVYLNMIYYGKFLQVDQNVYIPKLFSSDTEIFNPLK